MNKCDKKGKQTKPDNKKEYAKNVFVSLCAKNVLDNENKNNNSNDLYKDNEWFIYSGASITHDSI